MSALCTSAIISSCKSAATSEIAKYLSGCVV